ncbi:MAG: hypothetical protein KDA41_17025 [Planctomycetales bacterium]|nr:hypothetical protein [Planctomycetales bacterium]
MKSLALVVALLSLALVGCSGDVKHKVSGQVTVAGQPLVQGTIRFDPADGVGPTDGATISQGSYAAEVSPGARKVFVEAFKQVGEAPHDRNDPSSPILPVYESTGRHELTADVQGARSDLNFDLPAP